MNTLALALKQTVAILALSKVYHAALVLIVLAHVEGSHGASLTCFWHDYESFDGCFGLNASFTWRWSHDAGCRKVLTTPRVHR